MNYRKGILSLLLILLVNSTYAQGTEQVEMADKMRADGKIYVVVVVMSIVFTVLALYLFRMDRKISKIENVLKEKNK